MRLGPDVGSDFSYLMIGHLRQSGEDVAKIGTWINASAAAGFDDGVDDRSALAGSRFSDEEPVFLSNGGGANGVFNEIVVDLQLAAFQEQAQRGPLTQGIIDSLTEETLGQVATAGAKADQSAFESLHDWTAVTGSNCGAQLRSGLLFPQCRFDLIELLDLP